MSFDDLTREQKVYVKQEMLCNRADENSDGVSYGELAAADDLISDAEAREEYAGTFFVEDDFGF